MLEWKLLDIDWGWTELWVWWNWTGVEDRRFPADADIRWITFVWELFSWRTEELTMPVLWLDGSDWCDIIVSIVEDALNVSVVSNLPLLTTVEDGIGVDKGPELLIDFGISVWRLFDELSAIFKDNVGWMEVKVNTLLDGDKVLELVAEVIIVIGSVDNLVAKTVDSFFWVLTWEFCKDSVLDAVSFWDFFIWIVEEVLRMVSCEADNIEVLGWSDDWGLDRVTLCELIVVVANCVVISGVPLDSKNKPLVTLLVNISNIKM